MLTPAKRERFVSGTTYDSIMPNFVEVLTSDWGAPMFTPNLGSISRSGRTYNTDYRERMPPE